MCHKCKDTGRIRSGPIPQRAQGYLETWCDCEAGRKAIDKWLLLANKIEDSHLYGQQLSMENEGGQNVA